MGREIRRVPPNWQHPKEVVTRWSMRERRYVEIEAYVSMHDETYASALASWEAGKEKWNAGDRPSWAQADDDQTYEDDAGERPTPEMYRPYSDDEATWFQLFQTVSEGYPVSPPFATLDELASHLAEHGDDWDQERTSEGKQAFAGWGLERARAFCRAGWAPSAAVIDGRLLTNPDDIVGISGEPA